MTRVWLCLGFESMMDLGVWLSQQPADNQVTEPRLLKPQGAGSPGRWVWRKVGEPTDDDIILVEERPQPLVSTPTPWNDADANPINDIMQLVEYRDGEVWQLQGGSVTLGDVLGPNTVTEVEWR
jgi:hypothetical protein